MMDECFKAPVGSATDLMMSTLNTAHNLERIKPIGHSTEYKLRESASNPNHKSITKINDNYEITIDLSDIEAISKNSVPAKKMLVWAMIKANEQAVFNRQIKSNSITFSLSELVDNGLYSTIQSARTGFKSAMNALTSIKIKGQISGYRLSKIETLEVLFTGYCIKNSICTVYLNDRINWSFIFQKFTSLPKVYFSLSKRTSDLFYYIFYLLSFKQAEINKNGHFTIGLRTIQKRLLLPDENDSHDNPHYKRDIINPIKCAVEEISRYTNKITLALVADDAKNIRSYLNDGYLVICPVK